LIRRLTFGPQGGLIFRLYFFFFYFSGITHLLLQLSDATIFVGFRQAVYMSLLWLIPVFLFPRNTKLISAIIGLVLWATSMVSLGYFCIYQQEFSQSVLFVIFESNLAESSEYIENYFRWWMIPVFGMHTLIAFLLWKRIKPIQITTKSAVLSSLLILTFLFFYPIFKESVLREETWPDVVDKLQRRIEPAEPWQLIMGYAQYLEQLAAMEHLVETNKDLPPLENLSDEYAGLPSTLVLVIGESTNRQHMSLYGYSRNTTPELVKLKDELAVFNQVVSSRPTTIEALSQVLTFADQEHPDLHLTKPSLMNMMKQAGYKTYWITNQQTISKRNTMLTSFSKQMDEQYYLNHSRAQNSREYDGNVLEPLTKVLGDAEQRKFIVVHLLGTHMKYEYRYPQEFARFNDNAGLLPTLDDDKIEVINSYDNAVLYNDFIVSSIIKLIAEKDERSLMVYFADHGEDVYDSPPHNVLGRNEGRPTLPMYAVPFIIWASPQWQSSSPMNFTEYVNRPYSNAHFIHTWADLAGISFEGFEPEKSLVNPAFTEHPLLIGDPKEKDGLKELVQ
jgi:heptose-I-phosphate ethanolaminephosphotransferase